MKRFLAAATTTACLLTALAVPQADAVDVIPGDPGERTDLAVYHADGHWTGSPNARESRPALSLAKLYLGYYVLANGTPEERGKVLRMIRVSDDLLAVELDEKYPDAINDVAEDFELSGTYSAGYWGKSETTPYDLAKFVMAIMDDPVAEPLIRGMANHAPYAQDGLKQDFGTDQIDGAIGSKFGWADDRESAFGSVSFGPDWVVAAMSYGDIDEHTDDVHAWIDQSEKNRLSFGVDRDTIDALDIANGAESLTVWSSERVRWGLHTVGQPFVER